MPIHKKKRKFEMGRVPTMTKLGAKKVISVRGRGGARVCALTAGLPFGKHSSPARQRRGLRRWLARADRRKVVASAIACAARRMQVRFDQLYKEKINEMEKAFEINVPLTVDLNYGLNWLEAH